MSKDLGVPADVPVIASPRFWRDGPLSLFGELRSIRVPASAVGSVGKVTRSEIRSYHQRWSIFEITWVEHSLDSEAPLI